MGLEAAIFSRFATSGQPRQAFSRMRREHHRPRGYGRCYRQGLTL
jgi:hypothetical protein